MKRSIKPLVSLLFIVAGLSIVYKILILELPLLPESHDPSYRVEARVSFRGQDSNAVVSLQIPKYHPGFQITNENFVSEGFSIASRIRDESRMVQWSRKHAKGSYDLLYEVTFRQLSQSRRANTDPPGEYVSTEHPLEIQQASEQLWEEARSRSGSFKEQIAWITQILNEAQRKDAKILLETKSVSLKDVDKALRRVLSVVKIPFQRVRGFELRKTERNPVVLSWLEIWDGEKWLEFDVARASWGIPPTYCAWWRGSVPVLKAEGVEDAELTFSIVTIDENSSASMIARSAEKAFVWLYTLPAESQAVYRIILLIPIGGLLVAILRNVIGFNTFGTFMPVLIALAFRETRLIWGIILFVIVIAIGLLARFYFEKLRLLLIPRLAATLTVVVMLLILISGIAAYLNLDKGPSVALFPMVIMTMAIERMSVQWEESGPGTALRMGFATLCAASLVYGVITNQYLEYAIFTFPELLLVVLGTSILIGRYTGYRLFELWRFRSFFSKPQ